MVDPEQGAWDAYMWVNDADAVNAELKSKGVKIVRDISDKTYGCRDFDIRSSLNVVLVDAGNPKPQNQPVRRARSMIAGIVFALAGATIASVCIAPTEFALANSCAPTSHHGPPYTGRSTCHDDARMAGDAVVPASGERTTFQSSSALLAGVIASGVDRFGAVTTLRSASFTRPHDPSHLHTFVLLI